MMLLGKVFIFFSTAVPYMYIPDLLIHQENNVTSAQASLALTTLGVCNLVGRLLAGLGDLIPGHSIKIYVVVSFCSGISVALMPHCHTMYLMYAASGAYGLLAGILRSIEPSCMVLILGPDDLGYSIGIHMCLFGCLTIIGNVWSFLKLL